MAEDSQYQGSQAFNQLLAVSEQVNPGTGSLVVSVPIAHLPGIHDDSALKINLIYSAGGGGVFGLPRNWSFNLPFVIPGRTLVWAGSCYLIDKDWSSSDGYRSGIRYWNEKGTLFEEVIPPQPLPSGGTGKFSFRLRDKKGLTFCFDSTGKLLEAVDRFGNCIAYFYVDQFSGAAGNRLKKIVDNYGQQVSFGYSSGNRIDVTAPHGGTTSIEYSPQGIVRLIDCAENLTQFSYASWDRETLLVQASYPTGLSSRFDYVGLEFKDRSGKSGRKPAVCDYRRFDASRFDASGENRLLEHTKYFYGQDTGNTYTGFAAGCALTDATDALMDSGNLLFRYDVRTAKCDPGGNWLLATTAYFNYLHTLVEIQYHLVGKDRSLSPGRRLVNTYPNTELNRARTCHAKMPIATAHSTWCSSGNRFVPVFRDEYAYDSFGNTVSRATCNGEEEEPRVSLTSSYQATKWGGTMLSSTTVVDNILKEEARTDYALDRDQLSVASVAAYTRSNSDSEWVPWRTRTYVCDGRGRILRETFAAPGKLAGAPDSPTESSTHYEYAYDPDSHTLTTVRRNALGAASVQRLDMRYPQPLIVSEVDALGATVAYEHDRLGRTTASTDAVGGRTTYAYETAQKDRTNAVTVVSPSGAANRLLFDAIGRLRERRDSGNGTAPDPDCPRFLESNTYDCIGNVVEQVDQFGRSTIFAFDSLNRPASIVDASSNVTSFQYDVNSLSTLVNGVRRTHKMADGLGNPLESVVYAADATGGHAARKMIESTFDGRGRVIRSIRSHVAQGSTAPIPIASIEFQYDANDQVTSSRLETTQENSVVVTAETSYDLLGNVTRTTTRTVYDDAPLYTHAGDINLYDAVGQLVSTTNNLGQTETYAYDLAGNLIQKRRLDGATIRSTYTPDRLLGEVAAGDTVETYTHDAERRLTGISRNADTISYAHYADGELRSVSYGNGLQHTYHYLPNGRLSGYVDPSGEERRFKYTAQGSLDSQELRGETLRYEYDVVNGRKNVLSRMIVSGRRNLQYAFGYDSFDRPNRVDVVDLDTEEILFTGEQEYDQADRIARSTCRSPSGEHEQLFRYDGKNQVVGELTTRNQARVSASFAYDGNGNVLRKITEESGTRDSQSFEYNAVDQLVSRGIRYDSNGRLLENGELRYAYDQLDRLLVVAKGGEAGRAMSYRPDGLLGSIRGDDGERSYFYNGGLVDTVRDGDGAFQSVLRGPFGPVAVCGPNRTQYLVSSAGSVVASVGEKQTDDFLYASYGQQYGNEREANQAAFRWKTELVDEYSGLVYLRSRFYDSRSMRFLTADTYHVGNKYSFGFGDPVNQFDPTGHRSDLGIALDGVAIGLGIVFAAAAPFTGGTSLMVGLTIAGGLIGAASGVAGLVNDVSRNGNATAENVSIALGVVGLAFDLASAAAAIKAARGAAAAAARDIRYQLRSGIAFVGENHTLDAQNSVEVFRRVNAWPSPLKAVSLEAPHFSFVPPDLTPPNLAVMGVRQQYVTINDMARTTGGRFRSALEVIYHDGAIQNGTAVGSNRLGLQRALGNEWMQLRNEFSAQRINEFVAHLGDARGVYVLGGADHFTPQAFTSIPDLVNGNSRVILMETHFRPPAP